MFETHNYAESSAETRNFHASPCSFLTVKSEDGAQFHGGEAVRVRVHGQSPVRVNRSRLMPIKRQVQQKLVGINRRCLATAVGGDWSGTRARSRRKSAREKQAEYIIFCSGSETAQIRSYDPVFVFMWNKTSIYCLLLMVCGQMTPFLWIKTKIFPI